MEDTIIFNGLYAYQFRLDILHTKEDGDSIRVIVPSTILDHNISKYLTTYANSPIKTEQQKMVTKMLEMHFMHYYIFVEVGTKTRKLHLQGIIWSKNKYSAVQLTGFKAKFFPTQRLIKNAISITSAKKIIALASYVSKSTLLTHNTLTPLQISKIPEWKRRKTDREFKLIIQDVIQASINSGDSINRFIEKIIKRYWAEGRQQPTRMVCIKLLGIFHPDYTAQDYINTLNLEPNHNWSSY